MDLTQLPAAALIRHPDRGLLVGIGPFQSVATPPSHAPAFYVNTFVLNDPAPWKVPAQLIELSPEQIDSPPYPTLTWHDPLPDEYSRIFTEILERIHAGSLIKTVPALPQYANECPPHGIASLTARLLHTPHSGTPYAYWTQEHGFCGATPEILFHLRNRHLTTMALAGTAGPQDTAVFMNDEKEIREHEIVVDSILTRLAPYGQLHRSPRKVTHLGALIHFISHIKLLIDSPAAPEQWIKLLHPTPALGPQPKTSENIALLYDWRARLHCPEHFGAPFGFWQNGEFLCLVGIRSIYHQTNKLLLCSGGGIIASSTLTHEWHELQLKRQAVLRAFGLI